MAYVVPSPQVYEQLANAGGVLNTTADLNTCIIGPANNVINYDSSTAASLLVSKATTLADMRSTQSVVSFPNPKAGQVVDPTTVAVYANNAKVRTYTSRFFGFNGTNVLDVADASGTCLYDGSNTITGITATTGAYVVGDNTLLTLASGAGSAQVTLKAYNSTTSTGTISSTIAMPAATTSTTVVAAGGTVINATSLAGITAGSVVTVGTNIATSIDPASALTAGSTVLTLAAVTNVVNVGSSITISTSSTAATNLALNASATIVSLASVAGIVAGVSQVQFANLTTWFNVVSVNSVSNTITLSAPTGVAIPSGTVLNIVTAPTYSVTAINGATRSATITPALRNDVKAADVVTSLAPSYTVSAADPATNNVTLSTALILPVAVGTRVAATKIKATLVRVQQANLNGTTGTLRVEPGDTINLSYTSVGGVVSNFTTSVMSVVTSSGLTGLISTLTTTDKLPSYVGKSVGSASTTVSVLGAVGDTVLNVASATKVSIGTKLTLASETTSHIVTGVTGTVLTLDTPLTAIAAVGTVVNVLASVTAPAAVGTSVISVNDTTNIAVGDKVVFVDSTTNVRSAYFVSAFTASSITLTTTLTSKLSKGSQFTVNEQVTIYVTKAMNNQVIPVNDPVNVGLKNYTISTTTVPASITLNPGAMLTYGDVVSADIHIAYSALRTDLKSTILDFASLADIKGALGDVTDANPLGLACVLALANTRTSIKAIAVGSNDLAGYVDAMGVSEAIRLYAIVPLTQDQSILSSFATSVQQWSTPANASWRTLLANTKIPDEITVGLYSASFQNINGGNNTINDTTNVLDSSNSTFITDGVTPGDIVNVTLNGVVDRYTVQQVITNTQLLIDGTHANESGFSFYVSRPLSKLQKAAYIASVSGTFKSNRVIHIQPDTVGININGTIKYLPGYYLCAAVGGLTAGLPVQQGFTNIGVAGIADLKFSNFYFTKSQLSTISAAGTFLYVQEAAGTIPYCRHQLTTDLSDLNYREYSLVKNWDFLAYSYYDTVKSFIGTWNITADTLDVIKHSINAQSELLKAKKLPKIGAPLQDASITSLGQNALNKDTVDCVMKIAMNDPLNYLNLYLTV